MCTSPEIPSSCIRKERDWHLRHVCSDCHCSGRKQAAEVWEASSYLESANPVCANSDSCSTHAILSVPVFEWHACTQMLQVSDLISAGCEISQASENMQHFPQVKVSSMLSTTLWSCDCESFWAHAVCRSRGMWVYLVGVLYLTNLQSPAQPVNASKGCSRSQISLLVSRVGLCALRTPLSQKK